MLEFTEKDIFVNVCVFPKTFFDYSNFADVALCVGVCVCKTDTLTFIYNTTTKQYIILLDRMLLLRTELKTGVKI